jgi:DNA modification methylase
MTGTTTILRADARALPLADSSVDLVVTSPPYFGLRSYQDGGQHYEGQLGDEPTPAEFVRALLDVTRECARVLKPTGSMWVNLGDKYAQTTERSRNGHSGALDGGLPLRDQGTVYSGRLNNGGVPTKSLMGIPWRYALACIDQLGLILRAEVIWSKSNGLPESVTDRVRRSHETWFHFTLQPRYYSAVDEIREWRKGREDWSNAAGAGTRHGRDGGLSTVNPLGKLPGSVWTVPTQPLQVPDHLGVDHFAAFPMEWPRRIIQGWSPRDVCTACGEGRRPVGESRITGDRGGRQFNPASGDIGVLGKEREYRITGHVCACTPCHIEQNADPWGPDRTVYDWHLWTPPPTNPAVILDPFAGTGTAPLVAKAFGRHGIGVDLSADYCRLAEWRCNDPLELARAMQVERKPEPQIAGQAGLFD